MGMVVVGRVWLRESERERDRGGISTEAATYLSLSLCMIYISLWCCLRIVFVVGWCDSLVYFFMFFLVPFSLWYPEQVFPPDPEDLRSCLTQQNNFSALHVFVFNWNRSVLHMSCYLASTCLLLLTPFLLPSRLSLTFSRPVVPHVHAPHTHTLQHNGSDIPLHQMTASAVGNQPEGGMTTPREMALRSAMHADEHLFEFKVKLSVFFGGGYCSRACLVGVLILKHG